MRLLGNGKVDSNFAVVNGHTIDGLSSISSIVRVLESDEAKTAALASSSIFHNGNLRDASILTEQIV